MQSLDDEEDDEQEQERHAVHAHVLSTGMKGMSLSHDYLTLSHPLITETLRVGAPDVHTHIFSSQHKHWQTRDFPFRDSEWHRESHPVSVFMCTHVTVVRERKLRSLYLRGFLTTRSRRPPFLPPGILPPDEDHTPAAEKKACRCNPPSVCLCALHACACACVSIS